jgi:hypothetical protein
LSVSKATAQPKLFTEQRLLYHSQWPFFSKNRLYAIVILRGHTLSSFQPPWAANVQQYILRGQLAAKFMAIPDRKHEIYAIFAILLVGMLLATKKLGDIPRSSRNSYRDRQNLARIVGH